jgi:hypothetical protein
MTSRLPAIGSVRGRAILLLGRLVSGTFLALGIMGLLKTGADDLGSDSSEQFLVFTVHPLTAIVWTVLALVGVYMCAEPRGGQRFLTGAGVLLLVWAALALALDGSPTELFLRDGAVVLLHALAGALALVVALAPLPPGPARAIG